MALWIVKCKDALFPKWMDVRSETFGIYLIHPILIEVFQIAQARIPVSTQDGISADGLLSILVKVVTFAAIYLSSLLLTKQIRRFYSLRWMVGR
jgi:surface polysaccharide O-acyltransferase-like enzyme